jgi:ferrochelatase
MPSIRRYDAVLIASFGGPEKHEDVIPFLDNVLRGRNVPRERLLIVAEHYYHFDGRSPINQWNRELVAALQRELSEHNIDLPIYWGNRNWHPMLADTMRQMRDDGIRHALAIATSAFGSYSGCRQYRENVEAARVAVPDAPEIEKLPPFWNHPGFLETMADQTRTALLRLPDSDVIYTAHSIPVSMSETSPYVVQLREACRFVSRELGLPEPTLIFQSRSGPPSQPWLEPDIGDFLRITKSKRLVVVPIGFLSDHIEVIYDLDVEAAGIARERGIAFERAGTPGTHPRFVRGLRDIVEQALANGIPHPCAPDCCPPPARPTARPGGTVSITTS